MQATALILVRIFHTPTAMQKVLICIIVSEVNPLCAGLDTFSSCGRGDSVLSVYDGAFQTGPHSPDRNHDGSFRTPSYSSGPCSEAPGGVDYALGAAPAHRGHLHTTSWPPIGSGVELNMVRALELTWHASNFAGGSTETIRRSALRALALTLT